MSEEALVAASDVAIAGTLWDRGPGCQWRSPDSQCVIALFVFYWYSGMHGSDLYRLLEGVVDELPSDATRLSRALSGLASQLAINRIILEHIKSNRKRVIRLTRR